MTEHLATADLVVGQFYQVPAVRVEDWRGFKGWLPVMGPKHEDAEIVGFPWQHFHVDWRFVQKWLYKRLNYDQRPSMMYGMPVQCPNSRGERVVMEGPALRRLSFKRWHAPYPRRHAKWLPELEEKFACAKLVNGTCPHRGIPVSAMRRDGDVLTCPGHGLQWHAITGELVR